MNDADQLDPKLRTIGELFDDSAAIYTVPVYQRNYAWRAQQIEQLLSDIQDAIDEGEDGYSAPYLDLLGNLALVSVGANSKFSNSLPKSKADNFRTTIETQSPKLQEMARITRDRGWGDAEVRSHHQAMVALLRGDLGL
jgi:Protein of unknown function DUF262/Protein of unknown function (DUF1524)